MMVRMAPWQEARTKTMTRTVSFPRTERVKAAEKKQKRSVRPGE
jgi:hypothetical protein